MEKSTFKINVCSVLVLYFDIFLALFNLDPQRPFSIILSKKHTLAHFLSSFLKMFLKESFCQKFYFLFIEIFTSKHVSLFSFLLRISRKRKLNFCQNESFRNFFQKGNNKWAIIY